jgi:serine protease
MNIRLHVIQLLSTYHQFKASKLIVVIGCILVILTLALPNLHGLGNVQSQDLVPPGELGNNIDENYSDKGLPTNQIIIKFIESDSEFHIDAASPSQINRISSVTGVSLTYVREISGEAHIFRLPSMMGTTALEEIIEQLTLLTEVAYAEPDYIMRHTLTPNDPRYLEQWHYFTPSIDNYGINLPPAWDLTGGLPSVVVAVVDTGITNHNEFQNQTVPGYDFISELLIANDGNGRDNDPSDPGDWITATENTSGFFQGCGIRNSSWHGTHVAGTIGAVSNNGTGVAGINWKVKILPVRVLGKCGGYTSDIADGMRWAAGLPVTGVPVNANPAKVINLSLGGSGSCSTTYQNAINAINVTGATVVVAAGNSDANANTFQPANCNGVITVAATNKNGSKAGYSNYGAIIDISAPGGDSLGGILSTLNTGTQGPANDTYAFYQGTSMAAPHVSGVASLIYATNNLLQWNQVMQIMQDNVTPFPAGSTCTSSICGSGILNAYAALQALTSPEPPSAPTGVSASDGTYTDKVRVSWNPSSGATNYQVFRHTSNNSSSATSLVNSHPSSPYDDTSANVDTPYYYWVKACNSAGCSGYSTVDTGFRANPVTIPTAPTGVVASDGTYTDKVRVFWNPSSGATYYQVFRNTSNNSANATTLVGNHPSSPYDDTSATPEITFYYWVIACNTAGCSGYSGVDTGFRVHSNVHTIFLPLIILGGGLNSDFVNDGF